MKTTKTIYEINLPRELAQKILALRDERPELFEGVTITHTPPSEPDAITYESSEGKYDELFAYVIQNMNGKVRVTIDLERSDVQNTDILARLLNVVGKRKIQIEAVK